MGFFLIHLFTGTILSTSHSLLHFLGLVNGTKMDVAFTIVSRQACDQFKTHLQASNPVVMEIPVVRGLTHQVKMLSLVSMCLEKRYMS